MSQHSSRDSGAATQAMTRVLSYCDKHQMLFAQDATTIIYINVIVLTAHT